MDPRTPASTSGVPGEDSPIPIDIATPQTPKTPSSPLLDVEGTPFTPPSLPAPQPLRTPTPKPSRKRKRDERVGTPGVHVELLYSLEKPKGDAQNRCMNCASKFMRRSGGFRKTKVTATVTGTKYTAKEVIEGRLAVGPLTPRAETLCLCHTCHVLLQKLEQAREAFLRRSHPSSYLGHKKSLEGSAELQPSKKHAPEAPSTSGQAPEQQAPAQQPPEQQPPEHVATEQQPPEHVAPDHPAPGKAATEHKTPIPRKTKRDTVKGYVSRGQYASLFPQLWNDDKLRLDISRRIGRIAEHEVRKKLCNYATNPVSYLKQDATVDVLETFEYSKITEEAEKQCPMLTSALSGALAKLDEKTRTMMMASIVSQIAYAHNQSMRLLPQIIGLSLWGGMCDQETMKVLHDMNLSVGLTATTNSVERLILNYDRDIKDWKTTIQDKIFPEREPSARRRLFTTDTVETQSEQPSTSTMEPSTTTAEPSTSAAAATSSDRDFLPSYVLVFDNVNHTIQRSRAGKDHDTIQLNMINSYGAKDRIPGSVGEDYTTVATPEEIRDIPLTAFTGTDADAKVLHEETKRILKQIAIDNLDYFYDLPHPQPERHQYAAESSKKSEVCPLGVDDFNEAKNAELIQYMRMQHNRLVPEDAQSTYKMYPVTFYGDGASIDSGKKCQAAVSNAGTPKKRLEGLYCVPQDWHKRVIDLTDYQTKHYRLASGKEPGTLYNVRNQYKFKGVKEKTKESFKQSTALMEFYTESAATALLMHLAELVHPADEPEKGVLSGETRAEKLDVLVSSAADFIQPKT